MDDDDEDNEVPTEADIEKDEDQLKDFQSAQKNLFLVIFQVQPLASRYALAVSFIKLRFFCFFFFLFFLPPNLLSLIDTCFVCFKEWTV